MNLILINIQTCLRPNWWWRQNSLWNVGYELHSHMADCPESFVAHGWHGLRSFKFYVFRWSSCIFCARCV